MSIEGHVSLEGALRDLLVPSEVTTVNQVRQAYQDALGVVYKQGKINLQRFYQDWFIAYQYAVIYKIPEIQEPLAAQDFLRAVEKVAPDWARSQQQDFVECEVLNKPFKTVETYGKIFASLLDKNSGKYGNRSDTRIFATLGGRSDSGNEHECPCQARNSRRHSWKPDNCRVLRAAAEGRPHGKLSAKRLSDIRLRLSQPRWKDIAAKLRYTSSAANKIEGTQDLAKPRYPKGGVISVIIDPELLITHETMGVFATTSFTRHPLSDSTLLNSCGATHLVNSKDLLEPGSFVKSSSGECVDAGTSSLPILGRGKRVLRKILAGPEGPNTQDLTLINVVVVEGFHVNIVSEVLLGRAGVWYLGLDWTLRFGTLEDSVVLRQLVRKHNLSFIEYKLLSNYLSFPELLSESDAVNQK